MELPAVEQAEATQPFPRYATYLCLLYRRLPYHMGL